MSTLIQRPARGLPNILQQTVQGATPPALDDVVHGSVDLLQFYGQAMIQDRSSANTGGIGTSALLTVPQDQWWIVYHYGMQWTTDATVTLAAFTIGMAGIVMNWKKFQAIGGGLSDWTGTARQVHHAMDLSYARVLAPGKTINCTLTDLAGSASLTFQVNALIGVFG